MFRHKETRLTDTVISLTLKLDYNCNSNPLHYCGASKELEMVQTVQRKRKISLYGELT